MISVGTDLHVSRAWVRALSYYQIDETTHTPRSGDERTSYGSDGNIMMKSAENTTKARSLTTLIMFMWDARKRKPKFNWRIMSSFWCNSALSRHRSLLKLPLSGFWQRLSSKYLATGLETTLCWSALDDGPIEYVYKHFRKSITFQVIVHTARFRVRRTTRGQNRWRMPPDAALRWNGKKR